VSLWNLRPIERFHLENNLSFGGCVYEIFAKPFIGNVLWASGKFAKKGELEKW
jgi:hypothetical protein